MKIKLVLLAAFLCAATFGFAQTEQNDKIYKNDIGFNTVFILNGVLNTNQTPFSLMYKKYTKDTQALRLGISSYFNLNKLDSDSKPDSNSVYVTTNYSNASLVIGKEFQKVINSKWVWYLGADVVPAYNAWSNAQYVLGNRIGESIRRSYIITGRPFLGIRFNIHQRLYLSAEANMSFVYARNVSREKKFNPDILSSDVKITNLSFSLSPASGLFLYYRF